MANEKEEKQLNTLDNDKLHYFKGSLFLLSVTGAATLFGFGLTLAMAKKKDPSLFTKGLIPSKDLPESGGSLAMRALGWGTLYSVSGFSALCFVVWKAMGVKNLQEFREKMQSIMPEIPKKTPAGRSDFKTFRELLQYIIDESDRGKK